MFHMAEVLGNRIGLRGPAADHEKRGGCVAVIGKDDWRVLGQGAIDVGLRPLVSNR